MSGQELNAATIARAFEVMLPAREADSLFLSHNPHLSILCQPLLNMPAREQTAAEWLRDNRDVEFIDPLEQQKIEATGAFWLLEWTAPTEKKQTKLAAASLPALAQWLQDRGLAFGS